MSTPCDSCSLDSKTLECLSCELLQCMLCFGEERVCRSCWSLLKQEDDEVILEQAEEKEFSTGGIDVCSLTLQPWLAHIAVLRASRTANSKKIPFRKAFYGPHHDWVMDTCRPCCFIGIVVVRTRLKEFTHLPSYYSITSDTREEALELEMRKDAKRRELCCTKQSFRSFQFLPTDLIKLISENLDEYDILAMKETSQKMNLTLNRKKLTGNSWLKRQKYIWINFTQKELCERYGHSVAYYWRSTYKLRTQTDILDFICFLTSNREKRFECECDREDEGGSPLAVSGHLIPISQQHCS